MRQRHTFGLEAITLHVISDCKTRSRYGLYNPKYPVVISITGPAYFSPLSTTLFEFELCAGSSRDSNKRPKAFSSSRIPNCPAWIIGNTNTSSVSSCWERSLFDEEGIEDSGIR